MKTLRLFNSVPSATNWMNDFFADDWMPAMVNRKAVPAVNIKETNDAYSIEVAAPGYDKENFAINLEKDVLNISAEVHKETEKSGEANMYSFREFAVHSFNRSFTLPHTSVKTEGIEAKYENGILKVLIPKREPEEMKTTRSIAIA